MTIAYVVIFIFGFFGNACIIYIVASNKRMKSTFNFLIVNMAIGDLLVSLFIMPSEVSNRCVKVSHDIFSFSQANRESLILKAEKLNCRFRTLQGTLKKNQTTLTAEL